MRIAVARDTDTIASELRLVAALRRAAREQGGPLPSIAVADALLDERRELTKRITTAAYEKQPTGKLVVAARAAFEAEMRG